MEVEVSDLEPNVTIKPAACHVVPEVNLFISSKTLEKFHTLLTTLF